MPSNNNDDFLTAVQLTACARLAADTYFTPVTGALIPVVSEVKEDIVQVIKERNPTGMIVIVGISDFEFETGGGTMATKNLQLIVRVRETVAVNRCSTGTRENCLRVASKVAKVLNAKLAALSTDATPASMGGSLTPRRIERAAADMSGVIAWHVHFDISGGGLVDFSRRGTATAAGSP